MLEWLGGGLVFFAGTMIGFTVSNQYTNRPKHIRQLLQALQQLETEISYGMTPLPDALHSIARKTQDPLAALFRRTAEELSSRAVTTVDAWQVALEACWHRTAMRSVEKEVIQQLGATLGVSDREDQIKHLHLAMGQLRGEEEAAREDQRRYAKMWRSLGMLGGALIVILMF